MSQIVTIEKAAQDVLRRCYFHNDYKQTLAFVVKTQIQARLVMETLLRVHAEVPNWVLDNESFISNKTSLRIQFVNGNQIYILLTDSNSARGCRLDCIYVHIGEEYSTNFEINFLPALKDLDTDYWSFCF